MVINYSIAKQPVIETGKKQLSSQINQNCKSTSIDQNLNLAVNQKFNSPVKLPHNSSTMVHQCTCPKNQQCDDSMFNSFMTNINECQSKQNSNPNHRLYNKNQNIED